MSYLAVGRVFFRYRVESEESHFDRCRTRTSRQVQARTLLLGICHELDETDGSLPVTDGHSVEFPPFPCVHLWSNSGIALLMFANQSSWSNN